MPPIQGIERRLKSVFPPGFDSATSGLSAYSEHHTHSTEQLSIALIDNYSAMTPSDSIIVKSAWYGKQTISPKHEFILIQVEDKRYEEKYGGGLINYMVLDRNVQSKSNKSGGPFGHSRTSIQGGRAIDAFRVSYDGDVERLLEGCKLNPHRFIEYLHFPPENPLLLYELVTLAHIISDRYPGYDAIDANCYFFAGLIWDCLRELYPGATHQKPLEKERGKHGWLRCIIDKSQVEITCQQALERILWARSKIEDAKSELEDLIQSRIANIPRP